MSERQYKLLFVTPFQLAIRNVLYSGLADQCVKQLGADVSFASPYDVPAFKDVHENVFPNCKVQAQIERGGLWSPVGTSFLLRLICAIRLRIFALEVPNGSYLMHTLAARPTLRELLTPRGWTWLVAKVVTKVFSRHGRVREKATMLLERFRPRHAEERRIIEEERPDLVVLTSHCTYWADIRFQIEAERAGIPVVSFVFSWDNLFSRGPMMRIPDKLLVWSDLMRNHAIEHHRYPAKNIYVVGALQFALYRPDISEKEVTEDLGRVGINPSDEYFLYVPGAMTWEYDAEDFRELYDRVVHSSYRKVTFVFRPHPQSPKGAYDTLRDLPIIFDRAPNITDERPAASAFDAADMKHMGCLLKRAKAVISSWGTTALLEAAIFDKPILQLRWMFTVQHVNKDQVDRVVMFQKYKHLEDFDRFKPRQFCDSPEKIIDDLDSMFANDAAFKVNRRNAVEQIVKLPLDQAVNRTVLSLKETVEGRG